MLNKDSYFCFIVILPIYFACRAGSLKANRIPPPQLVSSTMAWFLPAQKNPA